MATKTADDQAQGQGQGEGGGGQPPGQAADDKNPTMAEVMTAIRKVVDDALAPVLDKLPGGSGDNSDQGTSQGGGPAADAGTLRQMVDQAIATVVKDRDQAAEAAAHKKAHEDLAARPEVRPIARLRRARWLGDIWDRQN